MARWDRAWHRRLETELSELPFLPMLEQTAVRRALAADPVAFALIYLDHHLRSKETGDRITFSEIHYEWARIAQGWTTPPAEPMSDRQAFIAPRNTGKTTWWFLILPLWAAALGHVRFIAAFAHSTGQAEGHLTTLKSELDTNPLLRQDFPELCSPARRPSGTTVADRQGMLHQRSGFVFAARGVDSASLGLKVGSDRPDLLILDDVEPDEASYSGDQMTKRLGTVTDAILPLNIYARVVMVGTVTMPGSITHQLVKAAAAIERDQWTEVERWIVDENIRPHHHLPITVDDDGLERSVWPQKWPLEWLQSRRHTREYAKNYLNDPLARDGVYWTREDFHYGEVAGCTRWILAVDPAVTSKKTSDFTGLCVLAYSPSQKKIMIVWARVVRLTGKPLREFCSSPSGPLSLFPEIKAIIVETNQGGELWLEVFHRLPGIKVITHTATVSKEIRFADALRHWQSGKVVSRERIPMLEEQAVAFPKGAYDDGIDAGVAGVHFFFPPDWDRPVKGSIKISSYV